MVMTTPASLETLARAQALAGVTYWRLVAAGMDIEEAARSGDRVMCQEIVAARLRILGVTRPPSVAEIDAEYDRIWGGDGE